MSCFGILILFNSRETSAEVRHRVTAARTAAAARWRAHGYTTNARVPAPLLRHNAFRCHGPRPLRSRQQLREGRITRRSADRTLAVAWTIESHLCFGSAVHDGTMSRNDSTNIL
ncbi:magnesium chelatase subunit ChlI family protein [Nocardia gipuzkoensis]